ncbi:hypothetical protein ACFYYD_26345 [Streptomyces bluensis]|uniref:hypothetical protein n=1 Tax=Streptomyces bluensis TaxID=33897 RepID=UPI0036BF0671
MPWLVYIVAALTGVGIIGLLVTLHSILVAVIVTRSCRKTLAQYSFESFWPQITKAEGAEATKGRPKNMTLMLRTAVPRQAGAADLALSIRLFIGGFHGSLRQADRNQAPRRRCRPAIRR